MPRWITQLTEKFATRSQPALQPLPIELLKKRSCCWSAWRTFKSWRVIGRYRKNLICTQRWSYKHIWLWEGILSFSFGWLIAVHVFSHKLTKSLRLCTVAYIESTSLNIIDIIGSQWVKVRFQISRTMQLSGPHRSTSVYIGPLHFTPKGWWLLRPARADCCGSVDRFGCVNCRPVEVEAVCSCCWWWLETTSCKISITSTSV